MFFCIFILIYSACCLDSPLNAKSVSAQRWLKFLFLFRRHFRVFQQPHVLKCRLPLCPMCLDYTVMRGMGTSGDVEYRCWPSYSHHGCVLSVHSAREAAFICNSHSQCTSFSLTGQKTWTGQYTMGLKKLWQYHNNKLGYRTIFMQQM